MTPKDKRRKQGAPNLSTANEQILKKLNCVPEFARYGKDGGGRHSDSKSKLLNEKQLSELWERRDQAGRLARQLVARCTGERCQASDKASEEGHTDTCDPLKRDTQTDFYRLMELLEVDGGSGPSPGRTA